MAKTVLLGLTACAAIGLGQERGAVEFDLMASCSAPRVQIEVFLVAWLVWRLIDWLAGRDNGDTRATIATAFTGAFVLAPHSVSWIVNPPAMIWLGLVGEATPWAAVAMVWPVTFLALKAGERLGEGAPELVTLASK